jgi:hypothetical protein
LAALLVLAMWGLLLLDSTENPALGATSVSSGWRFAAITASYLGSVAVLLTTARSARAIAKNENEAERTRLHAPLVGR